MTESVRPLISEPAAPVQTRWRRICTSIPAPGSIPRIERLRLAEPTSMAGMPPILWDRAEGFLVHDAYGNCWIDLTSGIVLANAGHAHPHIVAAIKVAADRHLIASYAFPTDARLALLEKLVQLSPIPDSKAILFCSGTEATECAMMLMRRHGCARSPSKVGILSFAESYHGRTLAAQLASGLPGAGDWIAREAVCHYQIPFPFCPECPWKRDRYEDCGQWCFGRCLEHLAAQNVNQADLAGVMAETVPGWATWPLPADFAAAMAAWAAEHEILLAFDEVQSGCCRTGRFFGFEHTGVTPDLITLGKGLTSSVPVAAVLGSREIMDRPSPGEMSSTHGGNPVCAAAALANLEVLEREELAAKAAATGALVLEALRELACEFPDRFRSIHGKGLFISAHMKRPDDGRPDGELADAVVYEAVRRGVMMFVTGRGFLKLAPPLSIDPAAALEAVEVIGAALRAVLERNSAAAP